MKAIALGAKGTYIGRAYIYGLGAGGEAGVTRALEIIYKELDTTMALCGERDIKNVGRHNLAMPFATHDLSQTNAPAKPRRAKQ
jgi:L-lactate dehydrogenase (cytochrome)